MSIDGALCPYCVGSFPYDPESEPAPILTRDCNECMGTEMYTIPWAELFKGTRETRGAE